ncbi:MAG: enoyl-CoA hydratase/isomerase family protein [Chloroflexi bacterium]|nr:enoyl-CoA hydratase/isomerase family protein [Chloroflexota bacterium]
MKYNNIILESENSVATIRLNRPDALNALNLDLLHEFSSAVSEVEADQSVKVLVIRGQGRAFCAGADLLLFDSLFDDLAQLNPYIELLNRCFLQLEGLPVPTIALVQGFALAGGLELVLACDMVLVAEDAQMGDQHANFGLMPGGGSTQRLPRRVGMQRAMELLTTGRWLSGTEAVEWGLALRAVPADSLDDELEGLLVSLRDKSRTGLGWIKSITQRGKDLALADGLALEGSAFVQYFATSPHPRQGIQAFKEKRHPQF